MWNGVRRYWGLGIIVLVLLLSLMLINSLIPGPWRSDGTVKVTKTLPTTHSTSSRSESPVVSEKVNSLFFTWKRKIIGCTGLFADRDALRLFLDLETPTRSNHTFIYFVLDRSLMIKSVSVIPLEAPERVRRVSDGYILIGPLYLALMKEDGRIAWKIKGNFTDAIELNGSIYALRFVNNELSLVRVVGRGAQELSLLTNASEDTLKEFRHFYMGRNRPILLSDGHYLYALWPNLIKIKSHIDVPLNVSIKLAKIYANGSIAYTKELFNENIILSGIDSIIFNDEIVLSLGSLRCYLIFIRKDGKLLMKIENPKGRKLPTNIACLGEVRNFNGRIYHSGWSSMIGFLDLIKGESLVREVLLYITQNNIIREVYLHNGTLYVCGSVQGPEISGAYIAKMDPDLEEDLNAILKEGYERNSIVEVDRMVRGMEHP